MSPTAKGKRILVRYNHHTAGGKAQSYSGQKGPIIQWADRPRRASGDPIRWASRDPHPMGKQRPSPWRAETPTC